MIMIIRKYNQDESDLGHPMSLLLIGCNKVLGLLVMVYLAYRSFFMTSNVTKDLNILFLINGLQIVSPLFIISNCQVQSVLAHPARQRTVVL